MEPKWVQECREVVSLLKIMGFEVEGVIKARVYDRQLRESGDVEAGAFMRLRVSGGVNIVALCALGLLYMWIDTDSAEHMHTVSVSATPENAVNALNTLLSIAKSVFSSQ